MSVDCSSWNIFSSLMTHTPQIIERANVLLIILITLNTINSFHCHLSRIYSKKKLLVLSCWKYFSIILLFFLYLLGESIFLKTNKLLPFSIKSKKSIQTLLQVIESFAHNILVAYGIFSFSCSKFSSKAIKACYIFTIHI